MKPERRWAYVRWVDSCVLHEQHDEHELPTPSVLESCGWVVAETADYVTLARDIHDRAGSADGRLEGIRSACSIPRVAIQAVVYLTAARVVAETEDGYLKRREAATGAITTTATMKATTRWDCDQRERHSA